MYRIYIVSPVPAVCHMQMFPSKASSQYSESSILCLKLKTSFIGEFIRPVRTGGSVWLLTMVIGKVANRGRLIGDGGKSGTAS